MVSVIVTAVIAGVFRFFEKNRMQRKHDDDIWDVHMNYRGREVKDDRDK